MNTNEGKLLTAKFVSLFKCNRFFLCRSASDYSTCPTISSLEEFQKESTAHKTDGLATFWADKSLVDEFLDLTFQNSLISLMELYCTKHFEYLRVELTHEELEALMQLYYIPQKIICLFQDTHDAEKLAADLAWYQSSVTYDNQLGLHDDSIRKITLIHASFDLNREKEKFKAGYFFETKDFLLFIKASPQLDLAIVYSSKK